MKPATFDLTGIGNAIVDVIAHVDDAFLTAHGVEKGAMTLIDAERAETLYAAIGRGLQASGGSAGNTMAGFASLGGTGAYIGKVAADGLGGFFRDDIRGAGVHFETAPLAAGTPTARCLIVVTPDAQRSMSTYLGACVELGPDDVDEAVVAASKVTYLEGYLFDPPAAKAAFYKAASTAHAAGRKVALTLSDSFCVHRHRAAFRDLFDNHIDILFANDAELTAFFETEDLEQAVAAMRRPGKMTAVTCGARGSIVIDGDSVVEVAAEAVDQVIDTTGAGDLYAAGFLYGWTRGLSPHHCGRLGGVAASEIISHTGARPEVVLSDLVRRKAILG